MASIVHLNNDRINLLIWWSTGSKIKIDRVNTFSKSGISQVNDGSHFTRDPIFNSMHFLAANSLFFAKYIDLDNGASAVSTFTFDKSFMAMNSNIFYFCFTVCLSIIYQSNKHSRLCYQHLIFDNLIK
jgi:hypothetical protein